MYTLPFLTVLISLMMTKKSSQRAYCILAGIFCTFICGIYAKNFTLSQGTLTVLYIFVNVMRNNISLFVTLLLFGILIQLITDSGAIKNTTNLLINLLRSKWHFFSFLILCAFIASVDDYLACILLTALLGTCYKSFHLSKTELCFYINTIVVAFCSSLPLSTWAPVIEDALNHSDALEAFSLLKYCFCYFTYFSVLVIFFKFFLKRTPPKKKPLVSNIKRFHISFEAILLLTSIFVLYVTFIVFNKCSVLFLANYSLLLSCILTLIFYQLMLLIFKRTPYVNFKFTYFNGLKSMWNLVKFLYLLWVYTDCLDQLLGINDIIFKQVTKLSIPYQLLPFVVFVFSGVISYCTGSVFATIRLLVPISITLGTSLNLSTTYLWLIASAALNGSLLASVSPLSDTITICCEELRVSAKKVYHYHIPYSIMTIFSSAIAYLFSGFLIDFSLLFAIIAPFFVLCPIIFMYLICCNEVKLIRGYKQMLYSFQITPYCTSFKIEWKFIEQTKETLIANRKYTTKPIRMRPLYRLKLC